MIKKLKQLFKLKYIEYFILSLILLIGLMVRLYKVDNPIADWHSWRQSDTASVTRTFTERGIDLLHPKYHDVSSIQTGIFNPEGYRMVEFPFYNLITYIFIKTLPIFSLEIGSRLVSILLTLVSAVGIYLIGKRMMGVAGGLLGAFFFLLIPYNIYFTRVILPEPVGVVSAIWALYLFIKYLDKLNKFSLFSSGVLLSIALLIKPYFIFYFVPAFYLLLNKYELKDIKTNRNLLINLLIFGLISFLPFFLWRGWISNFPEGIPFFEWAFNGDKIRFHPAFWRWIFGERIGHLILGSWGILPLLIGVLGTKPKNHFINSFLFGMLLYLSMVATANVRHDYYQIIIMPAIALGLASGTLYLWDNQIFDKYLSRIMVVFSIFVMLITGWFLIKDNYNVNRPELVEIGKEVQELTPKDAWIVAPYNGDTAFLYQTNRWGWPAVDDSIENIIDKGADYFLSLDPKHPDTIMVLENYELIKKTDKYLLVDLHKPIQK